AVGILAHGHVQHDGAVLAGDGDAEGVVAHARFLGTPHGHAALGVGPADADKACLGGLPGVGAAAHPVGGVLQRHAADAVLFGQGDGAVHAEGGVQHADAQVAVIVFHSALGAHQFRPGVQIDPAFLHILRKAGYAVQAVALDAFQDALGVDLGALLGLFLAQTHLQERLFDSGENGVVRNADAHNFSLL